MAAGPKLVIFLIPLLILSAGLPKHDSGVREFKIDIQETYSNAEIEEVHIIFMNHLDVGYDGIPVIPGFINNVLNIYFTEYIPRAIQLHQELVKGGYEETFIWTTHPWIIYMYLNCPENFILSGVMLKCPNATEKSQLLVALEGEVITYHAGPMNMQPENMNQLLFEMSLNISENLDALIGMNRTFKVLSQRDVPGMSVAVIPTLLKKGIGGVSVGVNSGSSPPAVPKIFRWKFDENHEIVAMWHPGGYPNNPGPDPAHPEGLSPEDCVTIENFPKALCFAFRTDNSGPPANVTEILQNYEVLRGNFPNARLHASTFESFLEAVMLAVEGLPVVTGEIGDTWISGIASDPRKMAEYRVVSETLMNCLQSGRCNSSDPGIQASVNYLIKAPEHTWGLPSVDDSYNWANQDFKIARQGWTYLDCESAWSEQRVFTNMAVKQLGNHSVVVEIEENLNELKPDGPDLREFVEIQRDTIYYSMDGFEIGFSNDGSIKYMLDPYTKTNWVSPNKPFGKFVYRTYSEQDFNSTNEQYSYDWWIFTKPGLTRRVNPKSVEWATNLTTLYRWEGNDLVLVLKLNMIDPEAHTTYGAPEEVWLQYIYNPPTVETGPSLGVNFWWKNKTVTRLPESLMYYFQPNPTPAPPVRGQPLSPVAASAGSGADQYQWRVSKLGHLIDPANVLQNGSQYLHAVDSQGIFYTQPNGNGLQLVSPDVPLVCVGTTTRDPSPFPTPLQPIKQENINGMAYNLYNNMWDTNYIEYYPYKDEDKDFKARFQINFLDKS